MSNQPPGGGWGPQGQPQQGWNAPQEQQPQGWGPQGHNPYQAPAHQYDPGNGYGYTPPVEEGSKGVGIAVGFIFGLLGLLGALIFAKPLTKTGAAMGFGIRIALTIVLVVFAALLR